MKFLILSISALSLFCGTANAKSCKSFKTHAEAQKYYETHKAKSLDRDGDGSACDCLPGGSGRKCPNHKK
ncbi:hypothetical protein DTO96_102408 [Ephemeroptericola cinctiostellae]|uniref:Excalibur calcium-binding domain-containing protein n=1 Tax=Ephemeroptericola cinctiostellae TaxID=2268024 RepID=A0A345DE65_9BURK|nr:excalibur calcium-binding domain-containing protein [Ephemeroptericola cinctiostellae]AXF86653.1 hypothetical protein DTO96_102408 [Ephemeroptericola cinctiostellae]